MKLVPAISVIVVLIAAATAVGTIGTETAAASSGLPCAAQRATLQLCGARTDNYKWCYNENLPPERRTWLAVTLVRAGGRTYHPVPGQAQFPASIRVTDGHGHNALLIVRVPKQRDVTAVEFRISTAPQLFGVFLEIGDRFALPTEPNSLTLRLTAGATTLGTTTATYRGDNVLATAAQGTPEYNGPGGRWFVAGQRTQTNDELGAKDCQGA